MLSKHLSHSQLNLMEDTALRDPSEITEMIFYTDRKRAIKVYYLFRWFVSQLIVSFTANKNY